LAKLIKSLLIIAFGTIIIAFGVINFSVTSNLASGGLTGISLILYHMFGIGTGASTLVLNIPLLIIYYRHSGKKAFLLTVYGVACLSGFLQLFEMMGPFMPDLTNDMVLAAVGFGAAIGVGTGIILKQEGTTGGVIVVTKLVKEKFGVPVAKTMLYTDAVIIGASLLLFIDVKDFFYSLIAIFVASQTLTKVQEGFLSGYKVLIFSDKYEEIAKAIQVDLYRGVTYIQGMGAYTKTERKILMVIVGKKQLVPLKQIVNAIDDHSFVSVSHTYETLGEGFTTPPRLDAESPPKV